ncbi:MAG: hypothetical protein ACOYMA_13720 [Bacteroidia bacterium]
MKITTLVLFIFFISSCCSDDKVCPDASTNNFSNLPYQIGQKITFKDSLGRTIELQLGKNINCSKGSVQKSSCSYMHQQFPCQQSININTETINDPNKLVKISVPFNISLSKSEDVKNTEMYHLSAFGYQANFYGKKYSDSIENSKSFNKIISYKTPYKTYQNVFESKTQNSISPSIYNSKFVIDNQGKLLSFSLQWDTLNMFHLVE